LNFRIVSLRSVPASQYGVPRIVAASIVRRVTDINCTLKKIGLLLPVKRAPALGDFCTLGSYQRPSRRAAFRRCDFYRGTLVL